MKKSLLLIFLVSTVLGQVGLMAQPLLKINNLVFYKKSHAKIAISYTNLKGEEAPLKNIFKQDDDRFYANHKLNVYPIYPNPVINTTYATIKYELIDNSIKAKIILSNILGNVIGEYHLTKEGNLLSISTQDFSSGLYFYTLNVDGKNLVTRRLVINHKS